MINRSIRNKQKSVYPIAPSRLYGKFANTMNAYRIVIILFLGIGLMPAFAQNGELDVDLIDYPEGEVTINMYHADTLYCTDTYEEWWGVRTTELPEGRYTLDVFINGELRTTRYSIEIEEGMTTYVTVAADEQYMYECCDSLPTAGGDGIFGLAYGQGFLEDTDYPIEHYFRIRMGGDVLAVLNRHFAIGFMGTTDFSLATIKKDTNLYTTPGNKNERFIYWTFGYSVFIRLSAANMQHVYSYLELDGPPKPFIDIGATYNLPLRFRYTAAKGTTREQARFIHNYLDFAAFARIGIGPVAFTGTYRLTNFVKDNWPEMPRLQLGLSFVVPL